MTLEDVHSARSSMQWMEALAELIHELQQRAVEHIQLGNRVTATSFHRAYGDVVGKAERLQPEELRGKVLYAIYRSGRALNPLEAAQSLGGPSALIDEIATALGSARMAIYERLRALDAGVME